MQTSKPSSPQNLFPLFSNNSLCSALAALCPSTCLTTRLILPWTAPCEIISMFTSSPAIALQHLPINPASFLKPGSSQHSSFRTKEYELKKPILRAKLELKKLIYSRNVSYNSDELYQSGITWDLYVPHLFAHNG